MFGEGEGAVEGGLGDWSWEVLARGVALGDGFVEAHGGGWVGLVLLLVIFLLE